MSANQSVSHLNGLPAIETALGGAPPVVLAGPRREVDDQLKKWKALEERIAGWAPATSEADERIDEDGYRLPARGTVALALRIAGRLCEGRVAAPQWVVQDGNGGIDFEWREGDRAETLSVNARGETDLMQFEKSTLVARRSISFAPSSGDDL